MTKGTYFRVKPEVLLQAFKSAPAPVSFVPSVPSIQGVVDDLTKLGYIKGNVKAEDISASTSSKPPSHELAAEMGALYRRRRLPSAPARGVGISRHPRRLRFGGGVAAAKPLSPDGLCQRVPHRARLTGGPVYQSVMSTFFRVFAGMGLAFVAAVLTGAALSLSPFATWCMNPLLYIWPNRADRLDPDRDRGVRHLQRDGGLHRLHGCLFHPDHRDPRRDPDAFPEFLIVAANLGAGPFDRGCAWCCRRSCPASSRCCV